MFNHNNIPYQPKQRSVHTSPEKGIDEIVGSLCDPIILHRCSWATKDFIPEWLRQRITLDRMIELMVADKEGREPTGTDSEALAYLMPACMEAPMDHDWAQIYLYLGTVVIDTQKDKIVPNDIRVDKLNRNQEDDLCRLKRWIYETKVKHRAGRRKEIKQTIKEEEKAAREALQPTFKLD